MIGPNPGAESGKQVGRIRPDQRSEDQAILNSSEIFTLRPVSMLV